MATMTSPRLMASILTVCFNAAGTIARTLDSVRAQSWRPLESVVVDGGSTDGTQAIVAEYCDITGSVVSEPDHGIYDAMNKAIEFARGEIIHFLNADDSFVDARVIEDAIKFFEADPELDLVFGDAIYVTGEGNFLRSYRRVNASNLIFGDLCHQVVFARKRLFDQIGGFNLAYRINADYDWLLRVFRSGARIAYLDRPVARFYAGGQSSVNPKRSEEERLTVRKTFVGTLHYEMGMFFYRLIRKLRTMTGQPEFTRLE